LKGPVKNTPSLTVRSPDGMVLRSLLSALGIYKAYLNWLRYEIKSGEKPKHIGIILDGNRRWAASRDLLPWEGHRAGAEKVRDVLKWCLDFDIRTITLYAFSTENFQRDKKEVDELMALGEKFLQWVMKEESIHRYRVKIKVIGRVSMLREDLQRMIVQLEDMTKSYDRYFLNLAIAYGGRAEIIDAAKEVAAMAVKNEISPDDITEEFFAEHLYTSHLPQADPDLIIRTSGETRLSGFLLWQSAYSEFCFMDVYWPDFREIDLARAIRTYQRRGRRYGK